MIFTDYSTQPLKYYTVLCVVLIRNMKIRGKANISLTEKFALLGILLIQGKFFPAILSCCVCRVILISCLNTGPCDTFWHTFTDRLSSGVPNDFFL